MTIQYTPNLQLPYPQGTDPADGPAGFQALATQLDSLKFPAAMSGLLSARPDANVVPDGIQYYATDTNAMSVTFGSSWYDVIPAPGVVGATQLASNAVTNAKITDNAVTNAKLADNAVGAAEITDGSITSSKLAANAVITAVINNLAVTNAKLGDGSVSPTKLDGAVVSSGGRTSGARLRWGLQSAMAPNTTRSFAHGDTNSPNFVSLQPYGIGAGQSPFYSSLNYDIPNSTQIRAYCSAVVDVPFAWLAFWGS